MVLSIGQRCFVFSLDQITLNSKFELMKCMILEKFFKFCTLLSLSIK